MKEKEKQELAQHILSEYTLKNRISYKWHTLRMKISPKYRNKQETFLNELSTYLKGGN